MSDSPPILAWICWMTNPKSRAFWVQENAETAEQAAAYATALFGPYGFTCSKVKPFPTSLND